MGIISAVTGFVGSLVATVIGFVVSLLVGGFGIYVGARAISGAGDYGRAVWTAVLGALAWAVISVLFGWIPILGAVFVPLIALPVWIGIINWRYPGGWTDAALIGIIAWLASLIALWLLGLLGVRGLGAFGVPGV